MTQALLKAYPAGFLGNKEVPQTDLVESNKILDQLNKAFGRSVNHRRPVHTANAQIDLLWLKALSMSAECKTFEFKELIIKASLTAFGTDSFSEWLSVQYQNPEYTKMHHRFIDETLQYIQNGTKREMSVNNWTVLLTSNVVENNTEKYTDVQQKFLLSNVNGKLNIHLSIRELILMWLRQKNGINDLMGSLFIMFGSR